MEESVALFQHSMSEVMKEDAQEFFLLNVEEESTRSGEGGGSTQGAENSIAVPATADY